MLDNTPPTLTDAEIRRLLEACDETRYPDRNRAVVLLACEAGLSAQEIAGLRRWHVTDANTGPEPAIVFDLAKPGRRLRPRRIPMDRNSRLCRAIVALLRYPGRNADPLIRSERTGGPMTPGSISHLFLRLFDRAGIEGSAHTGRATFIIKLGRHITKAHGTLRDVQYLAGHKNLDGTQRYLEIDEEAQKRVMGDLFGRP